MRAKLLTLGALFALALTACNPQPEHRGTAATPTPSPAPTGSGLPPLVIKGSGSSKQPVRVLYTKNNRTEYELQALAYQSNGAQGSSTAVFTSAKLHFYGKDGSSMSASAPKAVVDERGNTVTLSGGVHATTANGETLDCDTLVYNRATQMIHGQGHVVATDAQGLHATSNSIDSDLSLTHTRMQ